jgi:hypothetical protein
MPESRCRPSQTLKKASIPVKGRMNARVKAAAKQAMPAVKERTPAKARAAAQPIRVPDPGLPI